MNKTIDRISLATFFLLFSIVFYPTMKSLIFVWSNSEDYSHGFLILPIAIYIIWAKRFEIKAVEVKPSPLWFVFVLFSLLLFLGAEFASILTLTPIAMILFIIGSVIFLFGMKMFRLLVFPLCFLFLMIPIPSQIYSSVTMPLQLFVTTATVEIAYLFGIPILREGNIIHLFNTTLQVVEACSGLRSTISLFTLCTIFGYFSLHYNLSRIILCAASILAAILVNIFRVFAMVVSRHFFNYDLTQGDVHTVFGILIFFLALVIVYFFQSILSFGEDHFAKN